MSTPGDILHATGYEAPEPAWRTTSEPPVDPTRFGQDHWSTFAYIETRIVDHKGTINHDHMRCHGRRHPMMLQAKNSVSGFSADGSRYATRLAGGDELHDHDDYDCIDDLIAAGLLEVHMPETISYAGGRRYIDAYGRVIAVDGDLIDPDFLTGFEELQLCAFATFSLTDHGVEVASSLRQHKAAGGNFASFRMNER